MRTKVRLPKLAETTDVIVVSEWLVAVGDPVTEGQAIAAMETDKAVVEMVSPVAGTVVEILVAAQDEVTTGDRVCVVEH